MTSSSNGLMTTKRAAKEAGQADTMAHRKASLSITVCLLLSLFIAVIGFVGHAYATDSPHIHVSYQWCQNDTGIVEDFEVFDANAQVMDGKLTANVMPEAYVLDEECNWRVMKNFAGGIPAGEEDITREAVYDRKTGEITLPAARAGENLTVVFVMPWDHESHITHGHYRVGAMRSAIVEAKGVLSAASIDPNGLSVGDTFPLSISSGANGLESSPSIYAADTDVSGGATMAGYPELEGEYRFYVTFDRWNCELFELAGDVPGRWGNGGTVYGSSGTPYDYSWGADYKWCVANCVEAVYNTGGMPVPLNGAGSWVRIDGMSGNTLNCTFRIECNNPDGTNAQDIMGSFDLTLPKGAISLAKSSANVAITDGNRCYSLQGAVYGVFDSEESARSRSAANALATYTTGDDGTWESGLDFNAGTYYIAEVAAPDGYALSDTVTPVNVTAGGTATITVVDEPLAISEGVRVEKRDSATGASTPQGAASLEGAEMTFRYYDGYFDADSLPAQPMRTWVMRTDAQGVATPLHGAAAQVSGDGFFTDAAGNPAIPVGTLTVIETKAPNGYLLGSPKLYVVHVVEDPQTHAVKLRPVNYAGAEASSSSTPIITDDVARGALTLTKYSRHLDQEGPAGDASLRGATFEIVNESAGTVVVSGVSHAPGTVVATISTDENGIASTPDASLPFGTYRVRETGTSEKGYVLDGQSRQWSASFTISADGQRAILSGKAANVSNDEVRGNVALVKVDRDTGKRTPQGDATLAGARYDVINRSASPVPSPQTGEAVPTGSVVCTIVTDETGYAATDNAVANGWSMPTDFNGKALAYGTYEVIEQAPAGGYLVDSSFTATVSVRTDGQVARIETSDAIARGRLVVGKVSRETGAPIAQGNTSLENWSFEVVNVSDHPVIVDGAEHAAGDVVKTIVTHEADGRFIADTGEGALPYGTYEVHEIQTMRPQDCGYLFDDQSATWSKAFSIRSDGDLVDYSEAPDACSNQAVRGDLSFMKAESPSMERLAGIPFKITSLTTGEWHVIVTDGNGFASTEADNVEHTLLTNANDATVSANGTVDEALLNGEAGIWFSGRADMETAADDAKGALPFDTYLLEELPVQANKGLNLVRFEVTVSRDGRAIELGTISDVKGVQPQLSTSLRDGDGGKLVAARTDAVLVDTVTYNNLDTTATYRLCGSLHRVDEGQVADCLAEAEFVFTPSTTHGSLELVFTGVDTSALTGGSLVCFECLYDEEGREIASHADPEDAGQTISVPAIGTELVDTATGNHTATSESPGAFELTDTVAYTGLIPNKTYTLSGSLFDKTTGETVRDAYGTPVTATTSFTPAAADGIATLTFAFQNADLAGSDVVAYESLSHRGVEYAVHANLDDESQTVRIPAIGTSLADASSSQHVIPCAGLVTLEDSVSYENLEPGRTYTASAVLYDKITGTQVTDGDGKAISASVTFTPDSPAGTVKVAFDVDASLLPSVTVCFERLLDASGRICATHENLDDANQTVAKPAISTVLVDSTSGTHVMCATEQRTLVDTVSYAGLTPGQDYEVRGTLHFKDTGEPVLDDDGSEVTASVAFAPKQESGSIEVPFEFTCTASDGRAVVAYESVWANGREYAKHADIDDEAQTVYAPAIRTTLLDPETNDHVASSLGKLEIVDTVAFQALIPGQSYTITGMLVDKESGEAVAHGGKPIEASADITPTAGSGTVAMAFQLDAEDIGGSYVAFERLTDRDGRIVASHEDLDDAAQTIYVPKISTRAFDSSNGKHEAGATDSTTIVDEVSYEGLEPGRTYLIRGHLVDKASGSPIELANKGKDVQREFIPAECRGTERIEFVMGQTALAGKSLVAYEQLYLLGEDGMETPVASHEDIDDAAQTVSYRSPKPGDLLDKTGYWLLQHRLAVALAALGIVTCGLLIRERGKTWRTSAGKHAAHARWRR